MKWHITTDGSADGAIYHLRTHQARHTRQTAIASDPQVSLLARQRDLNHTSRDMQFAYQHTLRTQNQALLEKVREGRLCGPVLPWLSSVLGVSSQNDQPPSHFQEGQPSLLDARWRDLMASTASAVLFPHGMDKTVSTVPQEAYPKAERTFADALAAVRRHHWVLRNSSTLPAALGSLNSSTDLFDVLIEVTCYAA